MDSLVNKRDKASRTVRTEDEMLIILSSFLQLCLHKYEGGLTAEILVVLTIVALDRADQPPTVSDVAKLVGVPTSTASRYVANQMKVGHLEETISPTDRRQRLLRPTEAGRQEVQWLLNKVREVADIAKNEPADLLTALTSLSDSGFR